MPNTDLCLDKINELLYDICDDEETTMSMIEEYMMVSKHFDWNISLEWDL